MCRWARRVALTDGGVYDTLGLETARKRYDTILVSDAARLVPEQRAKAAFPYPAVGV